MRKNIQSLQDCSFAFTELLPSNQSPFKTEEMSKYCTVDNLENMNIVFSTISQNSNISLRKLMNEIISSDKDKKFCIHDLAISNTREYLRNIVKMCDQITDKEEKSASSILLNKQQLSSIIRIFNNNGKVEISHSTMFSLLNDIKQADNNLVHLTMGSPEYGSPITLFHEGKNLQVSCTQESNGITNCEQ